MFRTKSDCWQVPLLVLIFSTFIVGVAVSHTTNTNNNTNKTCDVGVIDSVCNSSQRDYDNNNNNSTTKKEWKWKPEAQHHRCNIGRFSQEEILKRFGVLGLPPLHPEPVVIRPDPSHNHDFRQLTSRANITKNWWSSSDIVDFHVTLSSSNSFSAHRRRTTLAQYLKELDRNGGMTTPDQLSNETWYLFGETYTEEWQHLLKEYQLPLCHTCTRDLSTSLAFGIGNRGSGVQWHVHGPGFSEALHGRKHWILYPMKPTFDPNYNSRHWMEYVYTTLPQQAQLPFECTLEPGDMIYFPDQWYHATINLDPYTAFISTFTTEHL